MNDVEECSRDTRRGNGTGYRNHLRGLPLEVLRRWIHAGQYTVNAKFRSAEGITVGTDVRLAGVKIGSVSNLSLDPETFQAIARLSIKPEYQMPDDSAAIISSEGLLVEVLLKYYQADPSTL